MLLLAWPVAIFVLRDRPEDVGQTIDGVPEDATAAAPIPLQPFGTLLSQRAFWLLLVGSATSIGSIATVNFLMKFVLEEQGFVDQAARNQIWATASSTALFAAIAGRLVVGHLADRWPRRPLMLAIYALVAVAIPMLFLVRPSQPGIRLPVRHGVRLRDGRRLHADPADGSGSVRPAHPRPRDVGDSARRHGHAVLVSQFHRAAARRLGRVRVGALGVVR